MRPMGWGAVVVRMAVSGATVLWYWYCLLLSFHNRDP